ncbi:hypothetical protein ABK040_002019 [Willaertia magna]
MNVMNADDNNNPETTNNEQTCVSDGGLYAYLKEDVFNKSIRLTLKSRKLELLDSCQGTDLHFIEINSLIERLIDPYIDFNNGGQFLHLIYNLEQFLSHLLKIQMKPEFIFFSNDPIFTLKTISSNDLKKKIENKTEENVVSENTKIIIEQKEEEEKNETNKEENEEVITDKYIALSLEKQENSSWKKLVKFILFEHLQKLNQKCHWFNHWSDKSFKVFLAEKTPAFIVTKKDDFLFRAFCSFEFTIVHHLEFSSNFCYGYVSNRNNYKREDEFLYKFLEENKILEKERLDEECLRKELYFGTRQEEGNIKDVLCCPLLLNHSLILDEEKIIILSVLFHSFKFIIDKKKQQDNYFYFFAILQLLTSLTTFEVPLAFRAHSLLDNNIIPLNNEIQEFFSLVHKYLGNLLEELYLNGIQLPSLIDLLDGRLFYKIWLLICYHQPKNLQQIINDWTPDKKYIPLIEDFISYYIKIDKKDDFIQPILLGINHLVAKLPPNKKETDKGLSINNSENKNCLHPLNNPLYNEVFFKTITNNIYSEEKSSEIISEITKGSKEQINETDSTHWKSRRLLEDVNEIDNRRSSTLEILHKYSLARYAKSLKKHEVVYLNDDEAANECCIKNEEIDKLTIDKERANNEKRLSLMQNLLHKMLESWISNIRIQYLDDLYYKEKKEQNRESLLKLISEAFLDCLELQICEINSSNPVSADTVVRLLQYCTMVYKIHVDSKNVKEDIFQSLAGDSFLLRLVKLMTLCKFTFHLAKKIVNIERENQSLLILELDGILREAKEEIFNFDFDYKTYQFVEMQTLDYHSMIFPPVISHDNRTTVLQFKPDPFQKEVIDHINYNFDKIENNEKKKSILVSTPTSSGKTFITMYLIERLLKRDNHSRIVFVVPSNALCNQVYAEIYNKFRKADDNDPEIVGMFTSDIRIHENNCRVLVTNAACFEILLLHYNSNTMNIENDENNRKGLLRYVVFDEIHHIGDESQGATWEHCLSLIRCPFIALSATIGNPIHFQQWLSEITKCKNNNTEVELVPAVDNNGKFKVLERLQPLEYYTFTPNSLNILGEDKLVKIHPLSTIKLHDSLDIIPQMSKLQILELLDASKEITIDGNDPLLKFHPNNCDELYDEYSLLKYSSFIKYKKDLIEHLKYLQKSNSQYFEKLYFYFRNKFDDCFNEESIKLHNIVPRVILNLKRRGLLPSIAFHFSKPGISNLTIKAIEFLIVVGATLFYNEQQSQRLEEELLFLENYNDSFITYNVSKLTNDEKTRFESFIKENINSEMDQLDNNTICIPLIQISENGNSRKRNLINYTLISKWFKENNIEHSNVPLRVEIPEEKLLNISLRFGIAMHHNSINENELQDVERLFRLKLIPVCFATGTLAFGINMPTKSVVMADDSLYLNHITFHQCAGRAGRRGFDNVGSVILLNINKEKICRYLTSPLPNIQGAFGLTTTFALRLMTFYTLSLANYKNDKSYQNNAFKNCETVFKLPLSLFGNSNNLNNNNQHLHYLRFALDFLREQNYIDNTGKPINFAGLVSKLFPYEPSNFLFINLLRENVFSNFCWDKNIVNERNKRGEARKVLEILVYLFQRVIAHQERILRPMSEVFVTTDISLKDIINNYQDKILQSYLKYILSFAKENVDQLNDCFLPLSKREFKWLSPNNTHCNEEDNNTTLLLQLLYQERNVYYALSSFYALSGNLDNELNEELNRILKTVKHTIVMDHSMIPFLNISENNLDSFVLDYFDHCELGILCKENSFLNTTDAYRNVDGFLKILKKLCNTFNRKKFYLNGKLKARVDDKVLVNFMHEAKILEINENTKQVYIQYISNHNIPNEWVDEQEIINNSTLINDENNENKLTIGDVIKIKRQYEAQIIDIEMNEDPVMYYICFIGGNLDFEKKKIPYFCCQTITKFDDKEMEMEKKLFEILDFIRQTFTNFYRDNETDQLKLMKLLIEDYNELKLRILNLLNIKEIDLLKFNFEPGDESKENCNILIRNELQFLKHINLNNKLCEKEVKEANRLLLIISEKINRLNFHFEEIQVEKLLKKLRILNSNYLIKPIELPLGYDNKKNCKKIIDNLIRKVQRQIDNNTINSIDKSNTINTIGNDNANSIINNTNIETLNVEDNLNEVINKNRLKHKNILKNPSLLNLENCLTLLLEIEKIINFLPFSSNISSYVASFDFKLGMNSILRLINKYNSDMTKISKNFKPLAVDFTDNSGKLKLRNLINEMQLMLNDLRLKIMCNNYKEEKEEMNNLEFVNEYLTLLESLDKTVRAVEWHRIVKKVTNEPTLENFDNYLYSINCTRTNCDERDNSKFIKGYDLFTLFSKYLKIEISNENILNYIQQNENLFNEIENHKLSLYKGKRMDRRLMAICKLYNIDIFIIKNDKFEDNISGERYSIISNGIWTRYKKDIIKVNLDKSLEESNKKNTRFIIIANNKLDYYLVKSIKLERKVVSNFFSFGNNLQNNTKTKKNLQQTYIHRKNNRGNYKK